MDDVQSWWEIPCIAHFCSLFRLYFDLIDFDIEELEEALLTDSVEEVASSLLQDLIVQLLKGCFDSKQDEITTSNYQMYLRRLFRKKCEEGSTKDNPFETDAAFHSLPLRTKVKILYDLCDFRLDNEDVPESLKSLESDSLRVEPLGRDSGGSSYWYFYGTRLYREDYGSERANSNQKRVRRILHGEKVLSKWQVVCYTEEDWQVLTRKFKNCKSLHEKNLHRTLSSDFLPELPRLFAEKERLQRKRMLEQQLRRSVRAVLSEPNQREDMPVPSHIKKTNSSTKHNISIEAEGRHRSSDMGDMEEDEYRRQREEQEKADRLFAEEMEREERKARLHLRERRGGGGGGPPPAVVPTEKSSRSGSSSNKKGGSRSSSGTSKSPSKSPSKSKSKTKSKSTMKKGNDRRKRSEEGRTTNNSLASSFQGRVLTKGARKDNSCGVGDKDDDDDDYDDEEDEVDCDDKKGGDDNVQDSSSDQEAKRRRERRNSRSRSRSSSPSCSSSIKKITKKKLKQVKRKSLENKDEKRSKSKDKLKEKDRKKRKLKKEKLKERERDKMKKGSKNSDKPLFDTNHVAPVSSSMHHHSIPGMSKEKVKSSVLFSQSDEDVQIGMHKVIESIKNHGDAWPFINPVDEDYAPNYYRVISSPMDLQTMEDKLDNQEYISLEEFTADFQRIVDNCIKYNGPSSEYTEMAETLQEAFNKSVQRYIVPDESDEEISIEYNNVGIEKKRPRTHTKKEEKEHKKENESKDKPKKSTPKSKPKSSSEKRNKVDKKTKIKHKLMRHHSRDSEAIENLDSATAETLKDIDKWLVETPKPTEFVSSGAAAFDNLRNRILESDNDRESKQHNNVKHPVVVGHKRKGEEISNNRPSLHNRSKDSKKRDFNDERDEDFTPPKKMAKKSDKHNTKDKSKSDKSKPKKSTNTDVNVKPKRNSDKHSSKQKRPHHVSKHRQHSGSSSSKRDSPPPSNVHPPKSNSNGPASSKVKKYSASTKDHNRDESFSSTSPGDSTTTVVEKPVLKHSKSFEDKKTKPPAVKRNNSLFNTLKGSGSIKKLQQVNKNAKVNSFHGDSKFKQQLQQSGSDGSFGKHHGASSNIGEGISSEKIGVGSLTRENSIGGGGIEKPEKKKCLLLNDNSKDRLGGPKLSLGTVLSTDAIKLGEVKKNLYEDEDVESNLKAGVTKPASKGSNNEISVAGEESNNKSKDGKDPPDKDSKEADNEEDEEEETDRKLEPSKGFKPEKCMPNLSAWIKAFGGPTKPAPGSSPSDRDRERDRDRDRSLSNSHHNYPNDRRKIENDPKNFKVMGRGMADSVAAAAAAASMGHSHKHSPVPKALGKHHAYNVHPDPHWNTSSHHKPPGEHHHPPVVNLSEEMVSSLNTPASHANTQAQHKKHRHRKMSTSSVSSQSESGGSPSCFNNADSGGGGGNTSGIGSVVVNPPRWVDESWAGHSHQSQSPSASSQVSSQSPANSPFSPVINSPPHTPQTPPRVGPVRVGFYQDITSQHSSPEKINEPHSNSNSNVASPSTPPTPTSNNNSTNSGGRGRENSAPGGNSGGKPGGGAFGGPSYPNPIYAPRYAASTPSPNVGPGSNLQSPSPGGMVNVESPPGNPNSPHSPNVPEYRPPPYTSQQSSNQQSGVSGRASVVAVTPAHSHHRPSSVGHHHGGSHSPAPSIPPYPPPTNHYGHPSGVGQPHPEAAHTASISQAHQHQHQQPQPVMAHMNQVQAHSQMNHQQHYDRYPPHNYHHQMNVSSNMPPSSLPSSSSVYSQNLTAAHSHSQRPSTAQPSPYPSNPYASNPRNINIPPNVYNNPMSSDPAMSRYYKPTGVSGGELSLTTTTSDQHNSSTQSSTSSLTSSSRGRSSRSAAAAAAAAASEQQEIHQRNAAANLEGKLGHGDLNGFTWPHNLASLSQIVNSIPNPMNAVGMANAYRQYDQAMAESMSKYQQRADPSGYTNLSASSGSSGSSSGGGGGVQGSGGGSSKGGNTNPPAAHSQPADKLPSDSDSSGSGVTNSRRQSSKAESKRSQSSNSKSGQPMVTGSAFNFSSLSPADLALYPPKDMSEGSLYSASPPSLAHRPDLYPSSTSSFHASFSSSSRTTAGGVPTPSISPYQIPPFIGSHPSPYQSQSSQPFAHNQPPRGLVDPYQQFFQSSPHVMGLLPPSGYPYPHGLGFNRPGWI